MDLMTAFAAITTKSASETFSQKSTYLTPSDGPTTGQGLACAWTAEPGKRWVKRLTRCVFDFGKAAKRLPTPQKLDTKLEGLSPFWWENRPSGASAMETP